MQAECSNAYLRSLKSLALEIGVEMSRMLAQMNKVHHNHNENISRILWYSDWLHNTTSAGNSIFVTNHNTSSCVRSIMQPIRLGTVEYEK